MLKLTLHDSDCGRNMINEYYTLT